MSLIARRASTTRALAPEGLHAAVCADIQDLGLTQTAFGTKHKVRIVWQLDHEEDGHRAEVSRVYTLSLHERAALRKDLESWRGRAFTERELDGFDLEKLIGINCQVHVVQRLSDNGTTYANVVAVLPPHKGTVKLTPRAFVRLQDRGHVGNGTAPHESEKADVPF